MRQSLAAKKRNAGAELSPICQTIVGLQELILSNKDIQSAIPCTIVSLFHRTKDFTASLTCSTWLCQSHGPHSAKKKICTHNTRASFSDKETTPSLSYRHTSAERSENFHRRYILSSSIISFFFLYHLQPSTSSPTLLHLYFDLIAIALIFDTQLNWLSIQLNRTQQNAKMPSLFAMRHYANPVAACAPLSPIRPRTVSKVRSISYLLHSPLLKSTLWVSLCGLLNAASRAASLHRNLVNLIVLRLVSIERC